MLPDYSMEDLGRLDVRGAIEAFEQFPWEEHRIEAETRFRLGVDGCYPSVTYRIGSYHINIDATDEEEIYDVEACLPPARKTLGLFNIFAQGYEVKRATATCVREMISVFFDPSLDRRRASLEEIVRKHAISSP